MEYEDFDIQETEGYWDVVGSEVGDGWKKLYKPVVEYIRLYNEKRPREERIRIWQIKVWSGYLSIDVDRSTEELRKMIRDAYFRSKTTCCRCGAEATERLHPRNSSYFVCCDECWEKEVQKYKQSVKRIGQD